MVQIQLQWNEMKEARKFYTGTMMCLLTNTNMKIEVSTIYICFEYMRPQVNKRIVVSKLAPSGRIQKHSTEYVAICTKLSTISINHIIAYRIHDLI